MRALLALLLVAAAAEAAFWGGQIATGLPPFYASTLAAYGGQAYLLYTAYGQNGLTIAGVALAGPAYGEIAGPQTSGSASSPYLSVLANGSLALLWTYSPAVGSSLLRMSVLGPRGWGPPAELTKSGVALSYASDGRLIYVAWQPYFDPTYSTTRLLVLAPNGTVLKTIAAPGLVALNGAQGGATVGVFANGTYAVLATNGTVERLEAAYAGFSDVGLYVFRDGALRYDGRSLEVPWAAAAAPASGCNGSVALAWSPSGRLAVYLLRGSAVQLRSLYVPGLATARGVCAGGYLYVEAESLLNYSKSVWAFVVPLAPPTPIVHAAAANGSAVISWSVPYPVEHNVTAVYLAVYLNGKPLGVKQVGPAGALNYSLTAPGNYTFAITAVSALGNATATASIVVNATAAPRSSQTQTATAPAPQTSSVAPQTSTAQAPTSTTSTAHAEVNYVAVLVAVLIVAVLAAIGWRLRGPGSRRLSSRARRRS